MTVKRAITAVVLSLGLVIGIAGTSSAATLNQAQKALADVFTLMLWSQPTAQEQALCAQFDKNQGKAVKTLAGLLDVADQQARSEVVTQSLGITRAQLLEAAGAGMKQGCVAKPKPIRPVTAVKNIVLALLGSGPAANKTKVCTAYATAPDLAVATLSQKMLYLPVSGASINKGVARGLKQGCAV